MSTPELQEIKVGVISPISSSRALVAKGVSREYVKVTASTTLTPAQSGAVVALSAAAGCTVTLPTLTNHSTCLEYEFVVVTNCTSNAYIITAGGSDIIIGGFNELETDTGDDGPSSAASNTTITIAAATDQVGDSFKLLSLEGNKWLVRGQTALDGGAAFS